MAACMYRVCDRTSNLMVESLPISRNLRVKYKSGLLRSEHTNSDIAVSKYYDISVMKATFEAIKSRNIMEVIS